MSPTAIKDIYAGMPDAKDEISTNQISAFLGSFVVHPHCLLTACLMDENFLFLVTKELERHPFFTICKMKFKIVTHQHVHLLSTSKVILRKFVRVI